MDLGPALGAADILNLCCDKFPTHDDWRADKSPETEENMFTQLHTFSFLTCARVDETKT